MVLQVENRISTEVDADITETIVKLNQWDSLSSCAPDRSGLVQHVLATVHLSLASFLIALLSHKYESYFRK